MTMSASQNAAIRDFWNRNAGNPAAIRQGMQEFGVTESDLAGAIGWQPQQVQQYMWDNPVQQATPQPKPQQVNTPAPAAPQPGQSSGPMTAERRAAIQDFFNQNVNNPGAVVQAMQQYGISDSDMASALGRPLGSMRSWLGLGQRDQFSESQQTAIKDFFNKNQNNPQALVQGMQQFGVGPDVLAAITGASPGTIRGLVQAGGAQEGFMNGGTGRTTAQWQGEFDKFTQANGLDRVDLSKQHNQYLIGLDDPLATYRASQAFNVGYGSGGGNRQYGATEGGAFGPGMSQNQANNLNFWGGQFQGSTTAKPGDWNTAPLPGGGGAGGGGDGEMNTTKPMQGGGGSTNGGPFGMNAVAVGNGMTAVGSAGGVGGGGNLGFSGSQGPNPYLGAMGQALVDQSNLNMTNTVLPGLRSGAQAAGQYGSSRQGIAEGVAVGQATTGIAGALSNLYGNAYNTDQANQTQRYGLNNSYQLGLGNLALGNKTADNSYTLGVGQLGLASNTANQNFYTSQRGQDLQSYQLGSNMYNGGVQGNLGIGAGMTNLGQQHMNAPADAMGRYSNIISPYSGMNSTPSNYNGGPNSAMAGLGGAMAGYQLYNNFTGGNGNMSGGTNNLANQGQQQGWM